MGDELERRDVGVPLGVTSFWGLPEASGATRPVLVAIAGSFMSVRSLHRLPRLLEDICHVAIAELPLEGAGAVSVPTPLRLGEHLAMAAHRAFRGRPLVMAGFGDAALCTLQAHAPEILQKVAFEPPLRTEKLGPLLARARAKAQTAIGLNTRAFLAHVYGATAEGLEDRDHRSVLRSRPVPVDVVVGDQPLTPARAQDEPPSHVDEAERAWLSGLHNVRLRIAPGAGNAMAPGAGDFAVQVLQQAVAFAAGVRRAPQEVVQRIAALAPRDAQRVCYLGPEPTAFEAAYLSLNPQARFLSEPPDDAVDLIVLHDPEPALGLGALLAVIAEGGLLLAATPLGDRGVAVAEAATKAGLDVLASDPLSAPLGVMVVRARKAAPSRRTTVEFVPYAPVLMDIRTRLPAEALSSDPDLDVTYHSPPAPQVPGSEPRVAILQRPGAWTAEQWRAAAARAIQARQVLVLEFDDHPEAVEQVVSGKALDPEGWERFRVVHAVQTSTEPLVELFRQYNPEVFLAPNAVFDLPPFPKGPRSRRVFYGGVSRGDFAAAVARALAPAIRAFPDTEFQVVGDRTFFEALPTERKQFSDYVPFARYLEIMADCSISLSPLDDHPNVETKSDAKYLDAARSGVLTIASAVVYERVIRPGENGLLAHTLEAWPRMLTQALADPASADRMARAAWAEVRAGRMFAHQIPARRAWYRDLLARREQLDRGILERSPEVAKRVREDSG